MENEKILNQAIELLKDLDLTNAESVQINNTKFDDGSSLIEVGVSYPGANEITVSTDEDELVASISLTEGSGIVKDGYKITGFDKREGSLEGFTTRQLHDELSKRIGVDEVEVRPHEEAELVVGDGHANCKIVGPCRIILNHD